jgi:gliding motility-associated-like protein
MQVQKPDFASFYTANQRITPELEQLAAKSDRQHPEYGILPWDAPCSDCFELPSRRTESSRYFIAAGSGGEHFYIQQSAGALHFAGADGRWLTRDPYLRPAGTDGVYRAPLQLLPTALDLNAGLSSIRLINGFDFQFSAGFSLKGESAEPGGSAPLPAPDLHGAPDLLTRATVGRDGLRAYHAWPGIDLVQRFREGEVETDFVIRDPAALPEGDRVVFSDRWLVPESYFVKEKAGTGTWEKIGGQLCWTGELSLLQNSGASSTELLVQKQPFVYDAAHQSNLHEAGVMGYRWYRDPDGWVVESILSTEWLNAPDRSYPVVVDPIVYGVATYTGGDIGFNYDATCFDLTDYCSASLTVTVPGKTTLTGAWFDATYFSVLMGCIASLSDCLMREAAFQIVGPCSTSPAPGSFWSCLPPEGDSSGTCFGDSLDMFNTIACIPPSCADHVLTFEMRTFHCSCNGPNCGVICHFMEDASWKITIEGRTVVENPILSPDEPDFTICEGDTLALTPTGQWGVPPYTYQWSPVGVTADTVFVSPLTNTTYTSIIFDACDNTDTVTRDVIVIPAPNPAPGPFEDCVPSVVLDAGAGFTSYFWPHSGETTQTVTVNAAGTYTVDVTDGSGCTGSSEPIVAILNEPPVVNTVPDTLIIDDGALAQLGVTTTSTGSVSYTWSPAGTLTCTNCPSPLAFPQSETWYYVFGQQFGCIGEPDSVLVIVNQVDLVLPNAFTPNDDGLNDVFRVTNPVLYPVFQMQIFDRWGEVIFQSDDIQSGWDGTYRGQDQELGSYIWVIRFRKGSESGEEVTLKGTVTLLR